MRNDWDNPKDVIDAVAYAQRTNGWNNRRPDVRTFELPNRWGRDRCTLYVVPARVWRYRSWQRMAEEWRERHRNDAA